MSEDKKKITIWMRLRNKYRISIISEETWSERWHLHLSAWGAIVLLGLIFLLALALFSLVILYTPIRNYLPGYSENIRYQLMEESARVDSLGTSLELQRQYLNIISQVVAGEAPMDTIVPMDSMQIIMREELLLAKSEATAEFLAQYEQKEKDNLQLFEPVSHPHTSHPTTFFPPVHGTVTTPFSEQNKGITIGTYGNKNASAVLNGTVIHCQYTVQGNYTMIIQHSQFLSIYYGIQQPLQKLGEEVKAGEVIGLLQNNNLGFELWKNGQALNPEDYIVF
jgi:murein DD-endopeptidase MepM/ murein hydrolase activator NlpD